MSKVFTYEACEGKSCERILEEVRQNPGSTLIIPPGVYEITSELAQNTMNNVLSGAYGENPEQVMFSSSYEYSRGLDLSGMSDVTVEANGATLLINGFMEPVTITGCKNVTLKGLCIDHLRKPYSKAVITKVEFDSKNSGSGVMTVKFGSAYPVSAKTPMPRTCIFDCNANRFSLYGEIEILSEKRKEISPGVWTFPFENLFSDVTGNELYVWHTFHSRPAILIENSNNIRLENVTVHSQPGMGVVAHRCKDLYFIGLRVVPSAGEHMSTNTDATHITSCRGTVEFSSCCFDGQGDDSTNVHTYYHKIEKTANNQCRIILESPTGTHSQSPDYPEVGDTLELTDIYSLAAIDTYRVVKCSNINAFCSELELDKDLPQNCDGLYFANASSQPKLYFHDCVCRSHLARGVLAKTKYVLIENNEFFDVVGTPINVMAEAFWSEGVATTEDVVIRHNRTTYCCRTDSIRQGNSGGITVSLCAEKPFAAVHKNVLICDNIIDCPHAPHGIYVSNAVNAVIERNSIVSKNQPLVVEQYANPDD